MIRDIASIQRDLENKKENGDIVRAKTIIEKTFQDDPDLREVLNMPDLKPYIKYNDSDNPTPAEIRKRKEAEIYNYNLLRKHICPWLKLNGLQKDVSNYIMFEVRDYGVANYDKVIKYQQVQVMCVVHEQNMETEYGIPRHDLLGCIVKDLLNFSNCLGTQLTCLYDDTDIIDNIYYCRVLKFQRETPVESYSGMNNKHEIFGVGHGTTFRK